MAVEPLLMSDEPIPIQRREPIVVLAPAARVFGYPPYQELPPDSRILRDYHWVVLDKLSGFLTPVETIRRMWLSWSRIPQAPAAVGHGILGSAPEFLQMRNPLQFLVSYFHRYQRDGLCRLRLGRRSLVLVGNGAAAKHILSLEHAADFPRGDSLASWRLFSEGGLAEGEATTKSRTRVKHLLGPTKIRDYFNAMHDTTNEWVRFLRAKSERGSLDLGECCYRFTLAGLGRELFSSSVWDMTDDKEENCLEIIHSLHDIFRIIIAQLAAIEDPAATRTHLLESKARLLEALRPAIVQVFDEASRSATTREHIQSLTTLEDDFTQPLDEARIRAHAEEFVGFLQAAFETTGTALTWIFYELAYHPEIQAQLILELHGINIGSAEDLKRVPLLRQVVEETLRLHPPIPFTLRDNVNPQAFPFCQTSPGETFVISPLLVHQLSWEDPEQFNPARFKIGVDDMTSEHWQQDSNEYLTFISGTHQCPGRHFAKQKLCLAVARILQTFTLNIDHTRTALPVDSVLEITLKPSAPIFVTFNIDDD